MKSLNGAAVVAAWSALAGGGLAVAQDADCNVNGIPDATEIAQGLVDDCNGNGIPDVCEYAGVTLEADQSGFGNGNPLVATFTNLDPAISDVRLTIAVRADLDSVGEFVQVMVGGSVVASLWLTDGLACPETPQSATVEVSADTFNLAIVAGEVAVAIEPSGTVGMKECADSFASCSLAYVSTATLPDCLGNGSWDGCDIAADPSLDCDGNGLVDTCEIDGDSGLDCDGNGLLDVCDLETDPSLDCDGNGAHDACDIAADALADCDGNGLIDECEIAANPSLDCTGNGVLNSCELQVAVPGFDYDCNGDGQHDACQIAGDPILDKNADGVLDECQYARGDFNLDLDVGPADLALLIGFWGTPDPPVGDLNDDGIIDGQDLGILLINWGAYSGPWGVVLEFSPDPQVITDLKWQARIIATGLPWRVRDNASQIEMLLVPPGTFMMGCSPSDQSGCYEMESPVHEVTLTQSFYLGRYEVTQAQWTAVMGSNPSYFSDFSDSPSRPVERVSWYMIQGFESVTGLRLPTEAEWEYACRAGTTSAYNNGSNDALTLDELAWFGEGGGLHTHAVGQKTPNGLGCYDMHGNVEEWCQDWYSEDYYSISPPDNPSGPNSGDVRVVRGGSWAWGASGCRSSSRTGEIESALFEEDLGFRVARTP